MGDDLSVSRGAVINITSDSGSIGFGVKESFASDADMYGYRMSKVHRLLFKIKLNGLVESIRTSFFKPYSGRSANLMLNKNNPVKNKVAFSEHRTWDLLCSTLTSS